MTKANADRSFHIVDVFAERRYAGNQLAVITAADGLDTEDMQRIAREMNFSETTFLLSPEPREGGFDVRIFTPAVELPFAGHPTLGTAHVIRETVLGGRSAGLTLNLRAGRIPVTFDAETKNGESLAWMTQLPPTFGPTFDGTAVAAAIGLEPGDYDDRFPVQEVSTGVPFVICPIRSLDAVRRARFDHAHATKLPVLERCGIFFFCAGAEEAGNHLHGRMFASGLGVAEDPATGSAAGCLAGYLVEHGYFGGDRIEVRVEQGYEIGRPSILELEAHREPKAIVVRVGGRVISVAHGVLYA